MDAVVFDTETTGLAAHDQMVEIAAVHVRAGRVVRQFHSLVRPTVPIDPRAQAVHGITAAMLRKAPAAHEVLPEFVAFVGTNVLVAHNAAFDVRMLRQERARTGVAIPAWGYQCSMKLARLAFPGGYGYGLDAVASRLGLAGTVAHRALDDTRVAAALLTACLQVPAARRAWEAGPVGWV